MSAFAGRATGFLIAVLLVALLASRVTEAGRDPRALHFTVQSCHDKNFVFLFNEEARSEFDSCETPLQGFHVMLISSLGKIAEAFSDENGEAVLNQVEVSDDEILALAICKEGASCIRYGDLSIASGRLNEGENFALYQDGLAE